MPAASKALGAASLVLALGALVAPVVRAGDPTSPPDVNSGNEGVHIVIDRPDAPGATCRYPDRTHLRKLVVQPPIVYAYDRSSDLDGQKVRWRFEVWTATDPVADWTELGVSPWQTVRATDASNARFTALSFTIPTGHASQVFFARVRIQWINPAGKVEGRSALGIHNYLEQTPVSSAVDPDDCFGALA